MSDIRVGIVGFGGMGAHYGRSIAEGKVPGARVVSVGDTGPARIEAAKEVFSDDVRMFESTDALLDAGGIDAVLIATPHYFHPPVAIAAFDLGLHVLTEKPAGVCTKHVREMIDAADRSGKLFAIIFQRRTRPAYKKLKEVVDSGELGEITRTSMVNTTWFRAQDYFDSGTWRATWAGEGGGVLINQSAHYLDLWQWICGMPKRVRAFCGFGKFHDIEVEDDVTAYVEYENGATGVLVTSTADNPGTNRFEISADNGKAVIENGELTFWRSTVPARKFMRGLTEVSGRPDCWKCEIPLDSHDENHIGMVKNWIDAIRNGAPLVADGREGINSLMLANAMLLSTWIDDWVELPIDDELYYQKLQEKIASSTYKKKAP